MEDYKKKYEQALDNFKKIKSANKDNKELVDFIEYEYPELKESEDERIRKELIRAFTVTADKREHEIYGNGITYGQVLSWLKKQAEQKPTDKIEPKFKVGDIVINKNSKDTVKIVQILHDSYHYSGWDGVATVHSDFSISEQDNWELVEHKHTWSEQDEKIFNLLYEEYKNIAYYSHSREKTEDIPGEVLGWLKSLKERMKGE